MRRSKLPFIRKKTWLKILKHTYKKDLFFLGPLEEVDPHFRELWDNRDEFRKKEREQRIFNELYEKLAKDSI